LAGFACQDAAIESSGLSARHAQTHPVDILEVLGQKHNLSAMVGVMSNLTIDGLRDRMEFSANGYRPVQIVLREWFQRSENTLPALFPERD
jgi:hypothetical protein